MAAAALLPRDFNKAELLLECPDEDAALQFAMHHHLLSDTVQGGQPLNSCVLGRPFCPGIAYRTTVQMRGKVTPVIYCPGCNRRASVKNAVVNGVLQRKGDVRGVAKAPLGRFNGTVSQGLLLIYYWSQYDMPCHALREVQCYNEGIQLRSVQNFYHHMNVLAREKLDNAPPMRAVAGGSVQIDEALFKGKRRANVGRLLGRDEIPGARQPNYGDNVYGPWVFGLVCRDEDYQLDLRMFYVERRDAVTLEPIVVQHVAPGSTVQSDQWAAYNGLTNWGGPNNYNHLTVNHDQNFVDPLSGANTQQIEGCWGHVKTALMRVKRGVQGNLDEHLAHFWFVKKYKGCAFAVALEMAAERRPML